MAKSKRFTPEQNMVLVEIEKTYGHDWDAVKEAKKTKNFLRIPDRTIQQKLYRIWRDKTGHTPVPTEEENNGSGVHTIYVADHSPEQPPSTRIPVTGYIENGYAVLTYTVRVKLPKN